MILAYSLAGFSSNEDGTFDMAAEAAKQVMALSSRRFTSSNEYIHRFSLNMKRATMKARRDGRITAFPKTEHLEPAERGRIVRFFLLGYFNGVPFWTELRLYHEQEGDRIQIKREEFELSQTPLFICVGSELIADMLYGEATVDPRLASYKEELQNEDALEFATSYIKACSDPCAPEIDPLCKSIGGHIHAAEITPYGFKWLIEPKHDRSDTR